MSIRRRAWLLVQRARQQKWIRDCGESLAGYIRRYGDPGVPPLDENGLPGTFVFPNGKSCGLVPVPNIPDTFYLPHYGNGGTAIWEADTNELGRIESELRLLP